MAQENTANTGMTPLPGIVCWGDSLTYGAHGGGVTYPLTLEAMIRENIGGPYQVPVINMGVGGESSITIVGRNGAIPYVLSEDLTIPADSTPVNVYYTSREGQKVAPLRQGKAGVNPVVIGGIEGTLSITQETHVSKEFSYQFTRSVPGETKTVPAGAEVVTDAASKYLDYFPVVYIGQNGGYADFDDLIRQQRAIIDHQTANQDRFLIVGLHTGTAESRGPLEKAMQEEYGDKYINLRAYMATKAMADAGLEPTEEDMKLMEQGSTPYSLMVPDHCHFNSTGYALIGKLIYHTMDQLGYFQSLRDALSCQR